MNQPSPVQGDERIEFVDILRGFAVFGILAANIYAFSGMAREPQSYAEPVDRAIVMLTRLLVEAKFYSLFSLLFGWGVSVQLARAQDRGGRFLRLYVRRLLILLLFGLLHGILIWSGDILAVYALYGFLLIPFRHRSERVLLLAAALALLFAIMVTVPLPPMEVFRARYEDLTAFARSRSQSESLYATGTYREIIPLRIQDLLDGHSWFIYTIGNIFGMFLLGMYVGRRRIFREVDQHLMLIRVVLWVGLAIGLLFNSIYLLTLLRPGLVPHESYRMVTRGARTIGAPALMLFYVAGIILLARNEAWYHRLAPLASVGRAALSNYLLQSLLCTVLFYGYGLGLYGQMDPLLGLILTVAIFAVQVRLSAWWLARYRFGPAEWLWRTLTYAQVQPMRHRASKPRWVFAGGLETLRDGWRRFTARVDAKTALLGVWVALLLWAAALVLWSVHLDQRFPPSSTAVRQKAAVVTPRVGPAAEWDLENAPETPAADTLIATPVVQPVVYQPSSLAASGDISALARAFRVESALAEIETLTGPPYLGRYPASPQGRAAADYIADQFAHYGLQPAGDDGTFFQPFAFDYVTLESVPTLVVQGPDGTLHADYRLNQDYSAMVRWYAGSGAAEGPVLWANNCTPDDFDAVDAFKRIVLCRGDSGAGATTPQRAMRTAMEHGATGLLLLTDPEDRAPDFGNTYFEPWVPEPIPVLRVFPSVVEDLVLGSGRSAGDLSLSFAPFPLATRARLEVQTAGRELCPASQCQARNVLGVIPGRDAEYADQVIILGAHYDHLGQAPDGTVWAGANDNASGVAVLLEIARTWHQQGYIPRHTVLFAAWDAEEEGLLGSIHYVQHPRYPLEDTKAMIQLDMVGAGGDMLWIDGGEAAGGELRERIQSVAEALGVETELTDSGRSDHVPFLGSGVPASLLIWCFHDEASNCSNMGSPQYHRPHDTAAIIEPDRLEAVGHIVGITVLGLTEGEPAIQSLLEQRAEAVEQGDLALFLDSSLPEQEAADRFWFEATQALAPAEVEMRANDIRIQGRTATARVQIRLKSSASIADEGEWMQIGSLTARFVHDGEGWKWGGPDLVWAETEDGFAVAYPAEPGREDQLQGLGQLAEDGYAEMAKRLGLPSNPDAAILLFPDAESLRMSTAPSLPSGQGLWVGPGVVKLVYTEEISASQKLTGGLAQLLLADSGLVEEAAPWLWQGLPLVFRAEADLVGTHAEVLPGLRPALAGSTIPIKAGTSYAAVDYLRERLGWEGLGKFVAALGQACREGQCDTGDGGQKALDLVLSDALQMDAFDTLSASDAFARAWQGKWRERLAQVQADLDAVLAKRVKTVLNSNEEEFLNTVDAGVPYLLVEEQIWFDDLIEANPEEFSLTGRPQALFEDGRVLAAVTLEVRWKPPGEPEGSQQTLEGTQNVMLSPGAGEYRWAGVPYEQMRSNAVDLLFPKGREELAQATLQESESIYTGLAAELGVEEPQRLIIKLYDDEQAFQASIPASLQAGNWPEVWGSEGGVVKVHLSQDATIDGYRPALAVHSARYLLRQMGVDSEWLLKGVSTYLSSRFDGGVTEQAAALYLKPLLQAIQSGAQSQRLYDLKAIPPDHALSGAELGMARAQTWDTVRYLVYTYGWETLLDLLRAEAQGQEIDSALQATTGQSRQEFEERWAESLTRAHVRPEWIDLADAFDPARTNRDVRYLASPALTGREAGAPGAEAAAAYIASAFAELGLVAAGEDWSLQLPAESDEPEQEESPFVQTVPLSRTVLLSAPRLEIVDDLGQVVEPFIYRQDFVLATDTEGRSVGSGGAVTGELVWIDVARADGYQHGGLDLTGKVVILQAEGYTSTEVTKAVEQGAAGLLLVGNKAHSKDLLAKAPLASPAPPGSSVPLLELTQSGYERLLAVAGHGIASGVGQGVLSTLPVEPLDLQAHLEVPSSPPQIVETANVLGLLPGSDPTLSQEVIIVGAHYDHVGDDPARLVCTGETADSSLGGRAGLVPATVCEEVPGRRYDGANDNASGVAVLLEIARLWQENGYHPKRSVLFAAWGAQERGEIGSAYYVEHPALPLESTVAMLQLDSVGGGRGYYLEIQGGGDQEALLQFNLIAAEEWVDGRLAFKRDWARSDQVPFRDAGVPSLLLTWRDSSEENWPVEIADEVEPYRLGVTGRMVTLALMALAQ